jgi:hypothetical protein
MKTRVALACLAAGTVWSASALAQSDDTQYCTALTDKYLMYVSSNADRRPRPPPADVSAAMSKCTSDARASIPVLEKALTNAQISLPPRG